MKKTISPLIFLAGLCICFLPPVFGQDGSALPSEKEKKVQKVQFNGLGRVLIQNTSLGGALMEADTVTPERENDGEFLLDLAINAQPNENTEVQSILRLRNEFGGFFGSGVTVEIRELWARGLLANIIKYRVGDFDHVMTPYTFYVPDEEGMINESPLFRPQKEVIYYEQFYGENHSRRLQGGKIDFGLVFPALLDEVDASGFIARIRGTDFLSVPSRFTGGGRLGISTQTLADSLGTKATVGINLANTWDDLQSGDATSGIRNLVWSVDFDLAIINTNKIGLHILGEAGRSSLSFNEDSIVIFDEGDSFLEVGAALHLKPANLKVTAGYIDVGPDFFSTAAQSKRIDLDREKTYFNRFGNDRQVRMPNLFDFGRDRGLYTFQLSDRLMPYDPRYTNVSPYGKATPNRSGIRVGVAYGSENDIVEAEVNAAFLDEIRGQGTTELKSFQQIRATADFHIDKLLDSDNAYTLSLGFQSEQTDRGGIDVEPIDFSSLLLELGLSAELFPDFELLLAGKFLNASGNEFIPLVEEYNDVLDFPGPYIVDDSETLIGAGLRYNFSERVYITLQYQQFQYSSNLETAVDDYEIKQFFVLYNMDF